VVELAPRVCETAYSQHASIEECLVAGVVIADQLARPAVEEAAHMLTAAAFGKVVNHCCHRPILSRAIAPEIRSMRVPESRLEHRHRSLVRVYDFLREQCRL